MGDMLERALRRVCKADGLDPDEVVCGRPRWKTYICASQRGRVFDEIDAERNSGLLLCAIAILVIIFGPALIFTVGMGG